VQEARIVAAIFGASVLMCLPGSAQETRSIVGSNVHFLATSTSLRSSIGESQDVYLAEIELPHSGGEIILARLLDEYPPYRIGIPPQVLGADKSHHIRLRRDRSCDRSYGIMPIRTAPGNPMAILPERLGFQPVLPRDVNPTEILPCYRTVRK
jgi:hypothetical protein